MIWWFLAAYVRGYNGDAAIISLSQDLVVSMLNKMTLSGFQAVGMDGLVSD